MSDTETELRNLKDRLEQLNREQTRQEMRRDQAKADLEKVVVALQKEFNVSSLEEARDLLLAREAELNTLITEISASLQELQ